MKPNQRNVGKAGSVEHDGFSHRSRRRSAAFAPCNPLTSVVPIDPTYPTGSAFSNENKALRSAEFKSARRVPPRGRAG